MLQVCLLARLCYCPEIRKHTVRTETLYSFKCLSSCPLYFCLSCVFLWRFIPCGHINSNCVSDLSIVEHKVFFHELLSLCEAEDAVLNKLPCYKSVSNLVPLRKSALRALAACHYIQSCREKIFPVLYKALEQSNPELQEAGFECMKKFISGFQIDIEMVSAQNLKQKQGKNVISLHRVHVFMFKLKLVGLTY